MKLAPVGDVLMHSDCKHMEIRDSPQSVENVNVKAKSLIITMACLDMVE